MPNNEWITTEVIDHELCRYLADREEIHGKLSAKGLTNAKLGHEVRRAYLCGMNRGLELCQVHLMQK